PPTPVLLRKPLSDPAISSFRHQSPSAPPPTPTLVAASPPAVWNLPLPALPCRASAVILLPSDACVLPKMRRDRSRPPSSSRAASSPAPLYAFDADTIAALKAGIDIVAYGKERGVTVAETTQAATLLARPAPSPPSIPQPASHRPLRAVSVSAHRGKIAHFLTRRRVWNSLLPRERQYDDVSFDPNKLAADLVTAHALAEAHVLGLANDVRNTAFQLALFVERLPGGSQLQDTPQGRKLELEKFFALSSLRDVDNDWVEKCCRFVLPTFHSFLAAALAKYRAHPAGPLTTRERDVLVGCLDPPRYTFSDDGTGAFRLTPVAVDRSFLEPLRHQLLPPSGQSRTRSLSSRRSRSGRSRQRRPRPAVDADGDLDLIGAGTASAAADTAFDPIVVDDDGDIDLVGSADDADAVNVDIATAADAPAVPSLPVDDPTGRLLVEAAARARQYADATAGTSGRQSTSSRSSPSRSAAAARAAEGSADPARRQRYNQPPPLVAPVVAPPPPPLYQPGETAASLLADWGHTPDRPSAADSLHSPSADSVSSLGLNGLNVRSPAASGVTTTNTTAPRRTPAPLPLRNPSPPADADLPPAARSFGRTPSPPPPPPPLPPAPASTKSPTVSSVPAAGLRASSSHASPRLRTPPVRGATSAPDTTSSRKARRAESRHDSPDVRHTSTRGGSGFSVRPRTSVSATASPAAGRSGASTPPGRRVGFQVKPRAR
ncbi:hypothetical protein HDU96_002332, partial [Phlyctochytrium bullatum]